MCRFGGIWTRISTRYRRRPLQLDDKRPQCLTRHYFKSGGQQQNRTALRSFADSYLTNRSAGRNFLTIWSRTTVLHRMGWAWNPYTLKSLLDWLQVSSLIDSYQQLLDFFGKTFIWWLWIRFELSCQLRTRFTVWRFRPLTHITIISF